MTWALQQKVGGPSAKAVLLILANRANHKGRCWPGIDGIAEQTELSRRSVIMQIKKLADLGLLCIEHRGGEGEGRKSNVYILHLAPKCKSCTLGQCANDVGQCANDVGQCAPVAPEPKDKPSKNHQRGNGRKKPDEPPDEYPPELNVEAWQTYLAHRRDIRAKSLTERGRQAAIRKWCESSHEAQRLAVADSIEMGYTGCWPHKHEPRQVIAKPSYAESLASEMRDKGML